MMLLLYMFSHLHRIDFGYLLITLLVFNIKLWLESCLYYWTEFAVFWLFRKVVRVFKVFTRRKLLQTAMLWTWLLYCKILAHFLKGICLCVCRSDLHLIFFFSELVLCVAHSKWYLRYLSSRLVATRPLNICLIDRCRGRQTGNLLCLI